MTRQQASPIDGRRFPEPSVAATLFADTRLAWLWLAARLYLGWTWLGIGSVGPTAPLGIHRQGELSWVATTGQTLVAIAVILGALTGAAAFVGGLLSLESTIHSSAAMTPTVFVIIVGLVLAWKSAGWIGFDRWLLPLVGMPWRSSHLITGAPCRR